MAISITTKRIKKTSKVIVKVHRWGFTPTGVHHELLASKKFHYNKKYAGRENPKVTRWAQPIIDLHNLVMPR